MIQKAANGPGRLVLAMVWQRTTDGLQEQSHQCFQRLLLIDGRHKVQQSREQGLAGDVQTIHW
jgi:hypothetical protein